MAYYNPNAPIFFGLDDLMVLITDILISDYAIISKNGVPVSSVSLVTGNFILLDSTDTLTTSTTTSFTNPFPGLLQYNEVIQHSAYYQITYTISALMLATTPDITFSLSIGSVIDDPSTQFLHFDSNYREATGTTIVQLTPNQQIGLYARTSGANDTMHIQNISISVVKIMQPPS